MTTTDFITGKLYRVINARAEFWLDPYLSEKGRGGMTPRSSYQHAGAVLMFIRTYRQAATGPSTNVFYQCFVFLSGEGNLIHAERTTPRVDGFKKLFEGPL